jgi:hypothetical protein
MDNAIRKFIESLSPAQWDEAEAIEAELAKLLREGQSEYVAHMFVATVMAIRKIHSDATVEGIYEVAIRLGLQALANHDVNKPAKAGHKRSVRVIGVPGNRHARAGVSIREA